MNVKESAMNVVAKLPDTCTLEEIYEALAIGEHDEATPTIGLTFWFVTLLALLLIFLLWFSSPYLIQSLFSQLNNGSNATLNFSDKFGAIGTLFSALAFWGVIVTILLQQHELRLTRAEMQRQRMEMKSSVAALRETSAVEKTNLLARALENELQLTMKAIDFFQSENVNSEYFGDKTKGLRQTRAWADFLNIRIQYIAGLLDDRGAYVYLKKSFGGVMMQEFWKEQKHLFKDICSSPRDSVFYSLVERVASETCPSQKSSSLKSCAPKDTSNVIKEAT